MFFKFSADYSRAKHVEKRFEDNYSTTDADTPTSSKFRTRAQRAELKEKRRGNPRTLIAVNRKEDSSSCEESTGNSPSNSELGSLENDEDNILKTLRGT